MAISSPFDILELRDEGELITRVTAWEEGPMTVTPRDGRPPKVVTGVRLTVPREDKGTEPPWWDVTAQTLRPALRALAPLAVSSGRWLRIVKYGTGAGARFSAELLSPDYTGGPRADVLTQAGP